MKENQRRKKRLEREIIQPITRRLAAITASQAKKIEKKIAELQAEIVELKPDQEKKTADSVAKS